MLRTLTLIAASLGAATVAANAPVYNANVTVAEVQAAQIAWCNALVAISKEGETKGQAAAKALAGQVLDAAYGYNLGPVLFKPTLTEAPQTFRTTREGALAYFVGGDPAFPKDTGFALKGWTACKAENAAIHIPLSPPAMPDQSQTAPPTARGRTPKPIHALHSRNW